MQVWCAGGRCDLAGQASPRHQTAQAACTQHPRVCFGLRSLLHRELLVHWGVHVRCSGQPRQGRDSSDRHSIAASGSHISCDMRVSRADAFAVKLHGVSSCTGDRSPIIQHMVRRDVEEGLIPAGGGPTLACCATPTGESPVPVGVGAPGSRPQAAEGDFHARAGRQKPVRRQLPRSGEQARGPQHEVKPAASTDLQPAGRAAHVTAKATSPGRVPKRAGDCGGGWGAARVQGVERNTRDPSALPESGQARSYNQGEIEACAAGVRGDRSTVGCGASRAREGRGA